MSDQYTPTTDQMRRWYVLADHSGNKSTEEYLTEFDRWLADIKMTERLFMLKQIMDVADFDPGQIDEYGRTEIPAYAAIEVHELNEIARLEDHEFMATTVEEWEKHISEVEAAAEQRGAARAWDEVADNLGEYAEVDDSLIHLADDIRDANPYRANQLGAQDG